MKNNYTKLQYVEVDNLKRIKIKYIVFGILYIVIPIIMLILESINGYGVSRYLDRIFSFILIVNAVIGVVLILKAVLLKDRINALSIFNIINTIDKNGKRINIISLLRILLVLSIITNGISVGYYVSALYHSGPKATLIVGLALEIIFVLVTIILNVFLDKETKMYKKIEEKLV